MNENGHSNEPLPGPGEGPGKRVLWYSNAPWAATGYGNQTGLICATLPQYGHPIAVLANYGLMGTKLDIQGVKVYPGGRAMHSNDIVQAMADDWEADVIISDVLRRDSPDYASILSAVAHDHHEAGDIGSTALLPTYRRRSR